MFIYLELLWDIFLKTLSNTDMIIIAIVLKLFVKTLFVKVQV